MTKQDLYQIFQSNLELLEREIDLVKKSVQQLLGKAKWLEKNGTAAQNLVAINSDILGGTRLMSFLVTSWLEARLMKILHEQSSVAYTEDEIKIVNKCRKIIDKWHTCFAISVCKSYGFSYSGIVDYSSYFHADTYAKKNYLLIRSFFIDIEDAITIRNKLAHGQWHTQINNLHTGVMNSSFLAEFDNIQKLDFHMQCYRIISDIISAYVTRKDKTASDFDLTVSNYLKKLLATKTRIKTADFEKYCAPFIRREGIRVNLHK